MLCPKQTLLCTRQALQTSITSKTVCDSSQSVPSIEVVTCRRHRRAQDRAVLPVAALAIAGGRAAKAGCCPCCELSQILGGVGHCGLSQVGSARSCVLHQSTRLNQHQS